jgi:hypothetical protein
VRWAVLISGVVAVVVGGFYIFARPLLLKASERTIAKQSAKGGSHITFEPLRWIQSSPLRSGAWGLFLIVLGAWLIWSGLAA